MRVLITGANGLVGGIAVAALSKRHDVRSLRGPSVSSYDVTDLASIRAVFRDVDVVIHCAGYQGDDWDRNVAVNLSGTRNVLEAAREAAVPRVVVISSGAVQAGAERREPIRGMLAGEPVPFPRPQLGADDPVEPLSAYAVSKVGAEAVGRMYADAHGMTVVVVRLGRVLADDTPDAARAAANYCSHRDLARLLERCVDATLSERFVVVYGLSANQTRFRDLDGARALLGYEPHDGTPGWPLPDGWRPSSAPVTPPEPRPIVGRRRRVLVVLTRYPQRSETYIKTEIEALRRGYDVRVATLGLPNRPYDDPHGFTVAERRPEPDDPLARRFRAAAWGDDRSDKAWYEVDTIAPFGRHLLEVAEEFRPDVVHCHYLHNAPLAAYLAVHLGVGFTIRAHSYCLHGPRYRTVRGGVLEPSPSARNMAAFVAMDECRGVLSFPHTIPLLVAAGLPERKLVPCYPVVNLALFEGHRAQGDDVMNTGPALPQKGMKRLIDLARLMPERRFDLYAIGHEIEHLRDHARATGSQCVVHDDVPHEEMPAIYARHGWCVYTADPNTANCGWPITILEAQAVGLGVCAPNVHPGAAAQLGGGGFTYSCISELPAILRQPYPDELRELGFQNVRRADVRTHLHQLTDLWE